MLPERKSIGERLVGWYGEAAYDVLALMDTKQQLSPYVRYEEYNTQDKVPGARSSVRDASAWSQVRQRRL